MHRSLPLTSLALLMVLCTCTEGDDDDTSPSDDDTTTAGDDDDSSGADDDDSSDDDTSHQYAPVSDVTAEIHDEIPTILVVTWTQDVSADAAWLEYTFEGEDWLSSPPEDGEAGAHQQVILGAPAEATVTFQVFNEFDGEVVASEESYLATTGLHPGEFPGGLPKPELLGWHLDLASSERWFLGSIEVQDADWYQGPWWLFVMDRKGRMVWSRQTADDRATMHAKVSRDNTHLLYEATSIYQGDHGAASALHRISLDLEYAEEIPVPGLGSTFDETDDGLILFDDYTDYPATWLEELHPDGTRRRVWDCMAWGEPYDFNTWLCDPNETLWFPETDTVLWSMWGSDMVLEIDRLTGDVLSMWGAGEDCWAFDPPDSGFDMQHYPHFTADGTLLVSTHVPDTNRQQRAREYFIDSDDQTLVEIWTYGEGVDHYAVYAGEAFRLDNGNTLISYGTSSDIREVTPDGDVVWEVRWPSTYLIGHITPIDDLYEINRGSVE